MSATPEVMLDKIEQLYKRNAALEAALQTCLVGGNHITTHLISRLGADFWSTYPYTGDGPDGGDQLTRDLWQCWASMMRAREAYSH